MRHESWLKQREESLVLLVVGEEKEGEKGVCCMRGERNVV